MSTKTFDAIVLGSGQGGTPLTSALAAAGHKVALVESTHIAGTCVNEGCTPTKTMVASAKVAYYGRRQNDFGVFTNGTTGENTVEVNMEVVRKRKRDIVDSFRGGSESRLEKADNVTILRGKAVFTGKREVEVALNGLEGQKELVTAEKIFINVGCRPAKLEVPGSSDVETFDSTSIMEIDTVPDHLVVIGGGYVGIEFAQMFRRFGSQVTIIQHGTRLLTQEDDEISQEVKKILEEDGVTVLLSTKVTEVQNTSPGVIVHSMTSNNKKEINASHILIAAGRIPNTTDLGLQKSGVDVNNKGFIVVNEKLETNVEGIWALGDVKGGPAFTHISYDDFRVLQANVLKGNSTSTSGRLVPYTVFIDPQLGRVGLTEAEAKRKGLAVRVASMPMAWVARALEMDESRGLMKVLVAGDSDQILGCAILGIDGGELMSMIQIAMMGKLPYTMLRDGIFAHPLLAESLNNLFSSLPDR